jgi:predicted permease
MEWMRIAVRRLAGLVGRRRRDAELDAEVREHIALATEEKRRQGLGDAEARTAALKEFGGVTQIKEQYRVRRGVPFLEQMARDVRYGWRQLMRSPGFTATAVLTLALGLGANTAIFSLVNALLLRPLPVPHADELAVLQIDEGKGLNTTFNEPMFRALEKRHDLFQDVGGFSDNRSFLVRSGSGVVKVDSALVSGEFFSAMETAPLLGRVLTPEDDRQGGPSGGFGVVISEGFWKTWFNGAPDVVGRKIVIADAPFTVVGVMPKSFIGADATERPEIYAPIWAEPVIDAPYNNITCGYHCWWMQVIARRKPGVTVEQANAALAAASNALLEESVPDAQWVKRSEAEHFRFGAEPGANGYSELRNPYYNFVQSLKVVMVLCAAMLLLACLNLASLLMARSAARERELATRLAMGATRRRLVQQLMVESGLIALMGTGAGLLAAPTVSRALAAVLLGRFRNAVLDTTLDLRVYGFAAGTAVAVVLLIGLAPALRATAKNLSEQIKQGTHAAGAGERKSLLQRALMSLEVALALVLVVGAGLLATSLVRLYATGLGFEPKGLVNLELNMNRQALDGDALTRWYRSYGEALSHLPGVQGVSFQSVTPLGGSSWTSQYQTPLSGGNQRLYMNAVAPAYFQTMRIRMLAGRDFDWSDTLASGRKIILNAAAAKVLFPGLNPLGRTVTAGHGTAYEVIGVVGDVHYKSIQQSAPAGAYEPITQDDEKKPSYDAVVRLDGPAAPLADAARILTARMATDVPPPVMTTMSTVLDASISSERMMALLAVFFAVCALLVTAIGLYGTLAYATARRTSEIGIRMALGAQRAQVVGLVFRENAWVAASGSLAGLVIAMLAARALGSLLYGTSVRDPWVLTGSVAVLTLIASAASLVPALRAARIDPMRALRTE